MNNYAILAGFIAILLVGAITLETKMQEICDDLNKTEGNFIWLPRSVSNFFYNEKINLDFEVARGLNLIINGIVKEQRITDIKCGIAEDYGYWVSMSDRNAIKLATSDKPITTFVRLWKTDEINVKPKNVEKEVKLREAETLLTKNDNEPVPDEIQKYMKESYEEYEKQYKQ